MKDDLCSFLDWDSKHFFYRIGKINKQKLDNNDFINIEDWIKVNSIECIYYLKGNNDNKFNIELNYGYEHVDTRVDLSLKIDKSDYNVISKNINVKILESFNNEIYKILDNSIAGTRFYNDKNFRKKDVQKLYHKWIKKSHNSKSSVIIIATINSKIIGLISSRSINNSEALIELVAVDYKYNHQGIGSNILSRCIEFWSEKEKRIFYVSTQLDNKPAISFYQKFGFEILNMKNWYHKWNFKK